MRALIISLFISLLVLFSAYFYHKTYQSDVISISAERINEETLEGQLSVVIEDDFKNNKTNQKYFLIRDKEARELLFDGKGPYDKGLSRIRVRGYKAGDKFNVNASEILDQQEDISTDGVLGATQARERKVAVILFNFRNSTSQPFTAEWLKGLIFTEPGSVKAVLSEMSYKLLNITGKQNIDGDVFGWYTLDRDNTDCGSFYAWGAEAMDKATAAGANLTRYNNYIFVYPAMCAGMGEAPGSKVWSPYTGYQTPSRIVHQITHELMHNFGTAHSNAYQCFDPAGKQTITTGTCSSLEYGSPYDLMGNSMLYQYGGYNFPGSHTGLWHVSAVHKAKVGWLGSSNIKTVTSSGTYTIYPLEKNTTAVQLIKIPKGQRGGYSQYYLELRKRYGFDDYETTWPAVNTVILYTGPDYKSTLSSAVVVDMTPDSFANDTYDDFFDGGIAPGTTFEDPVNNIKITVDSVSDSSAQVRISIGS